MDNTNFSFKAKRRSVIAVTAGVFALVAGFLWDNHLPWATFLLGLAVAFSISEYFLPRDNSRPGI